MVKSLGGRLDNGYREDFSTLTFREATLRMVKSLGGRLDNGYREDFSTLTFSEATLRMVKSLDGRLDMERMLVQRGHSTRY